MKLWYFEDREFIRDNTQWLPMMPADLLVKLDVLRTMWMKPIYVSGHQKAIGRRAGDSQSYHNIDRWGRVLAIDVQPDVVEDRGAAHAFYLLARDIGFTGIGFYPHWNPTPGFHLDVRRERRPGDPATWGFVLRDGDNLQVGMRDAMEELA